jgi:hypothetical protein
MIDGRMGNSRQNPFEKRWFPRGFSQNQNLQKKDFKQLYQIASLKLNWIVVGKIPENMVRVSGAQSPMLIVGLERYKRPYVNDFLIDKYEVNE